MDPNLLATINSIYSWLNQLWQNSGNIPDIVVSAFLGGFFAAMCTNYFAEGQRIRNKRSDKYAEHRNAIVQIEHELVPVRVNLSRNINSLQTAKDGTSDTVTRFIQRFYDLKITSGLNLKLLEIDLINDYYEIYTQIETINSDIQYLVGFGEKVQGDALNGKLNPSMVMMYPTLIDNLLIHCKETDKQTLDLVAKCQSIIAISKKEENKLKKQYLKNGSDIKYQISEDIVAIKKQRLLEEESGITHPGEANPTFVAPYYDLHRVFITPQNQ